MKSCQQKLPGMFLQTRETSRARLASEDGSSGSMSQSNELVGELISTSRPSVQGSFQPDFENANYGSNPSRSASQFSGISTLSPDINILGHIPYPDSCHDSSYDSLSRGSNSIYNYSYSGSDRLIPQSASSIPTCEDFEFVVIPPSDSHGLGEPISEFINNYTANNYTADFDYYWSVPTQTAPPGLSLSLDSSGENTEPTASNITSGSDAVPQTSS
jgi:hypothetical protein